MLFEEKGCDMLHTGKSEKMVGEEEQCSLIGGGTKSK